MELMNCKKCSRLFHSKNGATLCSRCNVTVDDDFSKVRNFIYDNPSLSLKDVSEATGVEVTSILKWIREGKIILSDDSGIKLCEKCGASIISGRYCSSCIKKIQDSLKVDPSEFKTDEYRGMHIKS